MATGLAAVDPAAPRLEDDGSRCPPDLREISGNEAAGYGGTCGAVRSVAAYPIPPADGVTGIKLRDPA